MKNLLSLTLFLIFGIGYAQTKLIAYKSHSGKIAYFETAITNNFHDTNFSNLGLPFEKKCELDSVIKINDDKSIIIATKVCTYPMSDTPCFYKKDTLVDSNLYENNDSIRAAIKSNYHFDNDIDSAAFLQYNPHTKEYKTIPSKPKATSNKTKERKPWLMIFLLVATGMAGVYTTKKKYPSNEG